MRSAVQEQVEAEQNATPLVHLEDVHRIYRVGRREVHAVRGVTLTVYPGQLVIVKGPSGSGKTTLLNMMGGLDRPTRGQVFFRGRNLKEISDSQLTKWRRSEIGFVFQSFALIQSFSAFENVELPMRIAGKPAKERYQRTRECLQMVGLLERAGHRTFELSGGEQQRVNIARAMVNRPRLLLADEPTGELDTDTGLRIMELFRRMIEQENVAVCMVTHDPAVMDFADVTYEMKDGVLVGQG